MAYVKEYSNSGSNAVRIQQLESMLHKQYNPRHSSIPDFVDTFQTIMSELEGLYVEEEAAGHSVGLLNDPQKKRWLLNAVATDASLQPLVQSLCRGFKSYEEVAHELRSTSIQAEYDLNPTGKTRRAMLDTATHMEPAEVDMDESVEHALRVFHMMGKTSGYNKAYQMMTNPCTMELLKIPKSIWLELTNKLKEEMNAIRMHIRKKRACDQGGALSHLYQMQHRNRISLQNILEAHQMH